MPSLYCEVTPIGLTSLEGLKYNPDRPAQHCRVCGRSFQPELARSDAFETSAEVRSAVGGLLKQWAAAHYKTHPERVHQSLRNSGHFLTPEAALKLVPLGIYPVQDMVFSDESAHAGLVAPRAPTDDVEGT
jgi:hypothetical protein